MTPQDEATKEQIGRIWTAIVELMRMGSPSIGAPPPSVLAWEELPELQQRQFALMILPHTGQIGGVAMLISREARKGMN